MVNKQRIINFPVPDWNRIVSEKFDKLITCFCYQYDFDSNFYGPYGFDSISAKKLLADFLNGVSYYNTCEKKLTPAKDLNRIGVYISDEGNDFNKCIEEYSTALNKNKLRNKRGLAEFELPEKPVLFDINEGNKIPDNVINLLIKSNVDFFIVNNFMPEAGKSMLFFPNHSIDAFLKAGKNTNIEITAENSINALKSW